MSSAYRATPRPEVLLVATRQGHARLDVQPTQAVLELEGRVRLAISAPWVELRVGQKKNARVLSSRLDRVRLVLSRTFPTGDVAVWLADQTLHRAVGLEPLRPLDDCALASARALDELGDRLAGALEDQGIQAGHAVELGRGENRALVELGDGYLALWLRPLFREKVQRRLLLQADGRVHVFGLGAEKVLRVRRPEDILVRGDFLAFEPEDGPQVEIWLPWIGRAERVELAAMCATMIANARSAGFGNAADAGVNPASP
jgi:hypothetical protein